MSEQSRNAMLDYLERATTSEWVEDALIRLQEIALHKKYIIVDDLWAAGITAPDGANSKIGHIMKMAGSKSRGFLAKTPITGYSARSNDKICTIWESKIFLGGDSSFPVVLDPVQVFLMEGKILSDMDHSGADDEEIELQFVRLLDAVEEAFPAPVKVIKPEETPYSVTPDLKDEVTV